MYIYIYIYSEGYLEEISVTREEIWSKTLNTYFSDKKDNLTLNKAVPMRTAQFPYNQATQKFHFLVIH